MDERDVIQRPAMAIVSGGGGVGGGGGGKLTRWNVPGISELNEAKWLRSAGAKESEKRRG